MSETPVKTEAEHIEAEAHVAPPENPFDRDDVVEFQHEDREAAGNIGKLLTAFFFYSLIVMMCVSWWAYSITYGPAH